MSDRSRRLWNDALSACWIAAILLLFGVVVQFSPAHAVPLSVGASAPSQFDALGTARLGGNVVRIADRGPYGGKGGRLGGGGFRIKPSIGLVPKFRRTDPDRPRPKCKFPKVGRWPNCRNVRIDLPRTGCGPLKTWRNGKCRSILPKACPPGMKRRKRGCVRIVKPKCPRSRPGIWPKCGKRFVRPPKIKVPKVRVTKPKPKTTIKPRPVKKAKTPKKLAPPKKKIAAPPPVIAPTPAPPVAAVVDEPEVDRRPDEIVVRIVQEPQFGNAAALARQYRLEQLNGSSNQLLGARIQRYRITDSRSVDDVLLEMIADSRVAAVQPNYLYRLRGEGKASSSDMIGMQYALDKLRLSDAHALATGVETKVAVIDSKIDGAHPELDGSIARTFNAIGEQVNGKPIDVDKADAHGTAIAGIIASRKQLKGVAPATRLLAANAFFREDGKGPLTTTFILLKALDWAHANEARIFNLSFAGPKDEAVAEVMDKIHESGGVLIAAAGNKGPEGPAAYPAAYRNVIAITASDSADKIYESANHGDYVAVAAPGVGILAPAPDGGYDYKTGTSFATAHVSGLVALMLEKDATVSTDKIRQALMQGAVDLGPTGRDDTFGAGRVDAVRAIEAITASTKSVNVPTQQAARSK
ncbi:MAG: S8 family serine peptidase [Pseudomonadota bacterium]